MKKIYSRFYYPIELYNPHVHLEYNYNNAIGMNEAEIKALQHEEYKNKNEQIKELKQREFIKKYNKNALLYEEEIKMKNKEEQLKKKREQDEILMKKKNFNKTVYQKNMKPFLKEKELKEKELRVKPINKTKSKSKSKSKSKNKKEKNNNTPNEDNDYNNQKKINNDETNSCREKKEKLIYNSRINDVNDIDNNVVDLRINLENQLLEEIKTKNKLLNNNEIKDEVNDKISTIKKFRTYGYLPEQSQQENEKNKKKEKTKKFSSEFERRRFNKAINNILTERLREHNIYIKNICSCGNLQKQLIALVEKGNITAFTLTDVDCENNCAFYKKKKAYLKIINDVLNSIKDIVSENFQNKIKEDKLI